MIIQLRESISRFIKMLVTYLFVSRVFIMLSLQLDDWACVFAIFNEISLLDIYDHQCHYHITVVNNRDEFNNCVACYVSSHDIQIPLWLVKCDMAEMVFTEFEYPKHPRIRRLSRYETFDFMFRGLVASNYCLLTVVSFTSKSSIIIHDVTWSEMRSLWLLFDQSVDNAFDVETDESNGSNEPIWWE